MRVKIPVLVFMTLAIVALAGCSQSPAPSEKPSTTPSTVPTYEGSKVYSAPTFYYQLMGIPTEGVTVKVYYVENGKVKDILNWYKEKLSDYEIVQDMAIATINTPQGSVEWGGVLFKKGGEAIGIWAISGTPVEGGKGTVYYFVKGPADKLTGEDLGSEPAGEKEQLPPSDQASGEEPLKRYPGSVMLSYYKDTSDPLAVRISIDYGTNDDAAKVARWYKKELVGEGWKLESESSDDSGHSLAFSRGSEYLELYVMKPTETTAYTEIDLSYSKKGLPSKDVVQGEEPLKRYPGSIMLEHTVTTYGGAKMVAITYGTNDDPEKVFQWYGGELKNSGWQVMSSSSSGTFAIFGNKEKAAIQLEIKKGAYTEINVVYTTQV